MKKWAGIALKAGLSIGVLVLIFAKTDVERIASFISNVHTSTIVMSMSLIIAQTLVSAYRWALITRGVGAPVEFPAALSSVYVSLAINQCLPSYVGGDAYRIYWVRRQGHRLSDAVRGVLIDRVSAIIALLVMTAAGTPFLLRWTDDSIVRDGLLAVLAAGAAGTIAFFTSDFLPARVLATKIGRELAETSKAARRILILGREAWLADSLAILVHALSAAILYAFAVDLGVNLSATDCLLLMPPITLLSAVPISIAGWGVREGVMVGALSLLGVEAEQALALSLLLGFVLLSNGILGLVPLILDKERRATGWG